MTYIIEHDLERYHLGIIDEPEPTTIEQHVVVLAVASKPLKNRLNTWMLSEPQSIRGDFDV